MICPSPACLVRREIEKYFMRNDKTFHCWMDVGQLRNFYLLFSSFHKLAVLCKLVAFLSTST